MGVSFKISRSGSRFKPKSALVSEAVAEDSSESSKIPSKIESNNSTTNTTTSGRKLDKTCKRTKKGICPDMCEDLAVGTPEDHCYTRVTGRDEDAARFSDSSLSSRRHHFSSNHEVSFTLNLFPHGYSIGKLSEDSGHRASLQDAAKLLHPYDRASETLFLAIESGWLPGDLLDDIPCKYVDGGLICEVRDFRKFFSDSGSIAPSADVSPTTTKVHLKMSLENVVKDISSMADDSWTYGDLMEVESRIVKALQPKLSLDPTPRLDRLSQNPVPSKLSLDLSGLQRKRLREMPDVTVTSSSRLHGKKISVGRLPDNSSYRLGESVSGDMLQQHMQDTIPVQNIGPGPSSMITSRPGGYVNDAAVSAMNVMPQQSKFVQGVGNQRESLPNNVSNTSVASPVSQDIAVTYNDNMNSTALSHGNLETQEGQMSPYSGKRTRLGSVADTHPHQLGSYMDSHQGPDAQWKNHLLQQQANPRGIQYVNTGMQRYSHIGPEGASNQDGTTAVPMGQQGMRYGVNGDHMEVDKSESIRFKNAGQISEAETSHMDPRLQQRPSQQAFMRTNYHQPGWNNLGQQVEKDPRKEEQIQKRKAAQSPRVSSSVVAQSPLSGKSAELAGGSLGIQYGAVSSAGPLGPSQREKSAGMPITSVVRSQSGMSGPNDSIQQAQVAGKWRSNSLPKTPAMSGVGSPASISNVSIPMNAASPSVSTGTMGDQSMLDKFSKIEMVTARHKLIYKRTKAGDLSRKPHTFSPQEVMMGLSTNANANANTDSIKDPQAPISTTPVCGNLNTLKIRVLSFILPDQTVPGNGSVATATRTRLIMSEKPQDGTIAMHFGDLEDRDYLSAEDYLPTLPTSHFADLLASQFSVLMIRDGYDITGHVQSRPPVRPAVPPTNQPNTPSIPSSVSESQQYAEAAPAPQMHETKPIITANAAINSPPNLLSNTGMSPGGNPQGLQMPHGLAHGGSAQARPAQLDAHQLGQQHPQLSNQQQMIHQHQPQFSRSILLPPTNHPNAMGQNSNLPLGSQMGNKPSLQMLQQQQQPTSQQQPPTQAQLQTQMQRNMLMGLVPGVGMGNITNNMGGLNGLGNAMGMGPRGIGVSSGSIPGIANIGLTNTISQRLRTGALTQMQAQAILHSRMRMPQTRGMLGGTQPGMGAMAGARQNNPGLSILNQTLNRGGNINPMQRSAMGTMAAPRLMTGMNVLMNQQQQQQMLQIQQQQQQMQQHHQQQQSMPDPQPQQQAASPLQSVVSPQQVSSPSMGIPQQINQPGVVQQQQQQASPQMSSGAMNPEPGPASPQLSSQTLGSVGSMTNSPMDMQGVNKKSGA